MRELDRLADFLKNAQQTGEPGLRTAVFIERLSLNEFHRIVDAIVGETTDVVDRDDPRVFELGDDPDFTDHARGEGAGCVGEREDFERDQAVEFAIPGEKNRAHTTDSDLFEQLKFGAAEIGLIDQTTQMAEAIVGCVSSRDGM